jgi:hypothetical protein
MVAQGQVISRLWLGGTIATQQQQQQPGERQAHFIPLLATVNAGPAVAFCLLDAAMTVQ